MSALNIDFMPDFLVNKRKTVLHRTYYNALINVLNLYSGENNAVGDPERMVIYIYIYIEEHRAFHREGTTEWKQNQRT